MQPNNSDPEKALQQATLRRQRLLYSLNDLQQALSASAFLHELDEGEKYSKVDLRRFRCFETTLVIAYTRPFSQSKGRFPPLTMKMIDFKPTPENLALHDQLMLMRNQIMAHSDAEMMRMTIAPFDIPFDDGTPPINLFQAVFDEGVTLIGSLLLETDILLHEVHNALFRTLFKDVQQNPASFDLRIDSDGAKTARSLRV
ncbi:hypothetical protein [Tardiphaga sp. 619_E2_N8_5]|uniref:hypothetical protein n=1 Tax=unclassified Tardiphaga TaxID=2631404 RepID=UPI003F28688B